MVGSNKGSLTVGWGSKAMKRSRVGGTSPDVGCSIVSGSMRRVTSPVDPSWCVGVGSSEFADGGGVDTEVSIGAGTEVSIEEPPEGCNISDLLSLSDSSIAFLKSWAYRFSFFFRLIGFGTEDEGCDAGVADIEISYEEPAEACNEVSCGYDTS